MWRLLFFGVHIFWRQKFYTNSHDNITLIVSAIAASNKFRDENLAHDEQKDGYPCFIVKLQSDNFFKSINISQ